MSAEMYTFHEAIDEMQRAEEEVLDNHKAVCDYLQHALQRCTQLLAITRDVDYDQDGRPHPRYDTPPLVTTPTSLLLSQMIEAHRFF